MKILGIESSCDETAVSVVEDGKKVLSNVIASSLEEHILYGGVVPEIASRKHVEAIAGLADQALAQAGVSRAELDGVAVTNLDILQEITYASTVGQELQATIYREGREIPLTLIMGEEKH